MDIQEYKKLIAVNPERTDGVIIGSTVDCDECKHCIGVVNPRFTIAELNDVAARHAWIHDVVVRSPLGGALL